MRKIEELIGGGVRIDALACNNELAFDVVIRKRYPMLSEALLCRASGQLRDTATLAGVLTQRPQSSYFFINAFDPNKRLPASSASMVGAQDESNDAPTNRNPFVTNHPPDISIPLAALDAVLILAGPKGERYVPINEFYISSEKTRERNTVLLPGERITFIEIHSVPFATNSCYLKVRDRLSDEFAHTSAAVALKVDNGIIRDARLALGGLGTMPWRCHKAEQLLAGASNNIQSYNLAAETALNDIKLAGYNAFILKFAKRTIIRALQTIGGVSSMSRMDSLATQSR